MRSIPQKGRARITGISGYETQLQREISLLMIYYCWEFNPNLILKGQCQMNRQFLFVCITKARKLLLSGNYSRLILFLLLASNLSVLTARADGPTKNKVVFAVIGDSGTGKQDQIDLARVMEKFYEREPFDTVIMLGDNIYGDVSRKSLHQCFEKRSEERRVGKECRAQW